MHVEVKVPNHDPIDKEFVYDEIDVKKDRNGSPVVLREIQVGNHIHVNVEKTPQTQGSYCEDEECMILAIQHPISLDNQVSESESLVI